MWIYFNESNQQAELQLHLHPHYTDHPTYKPSMGKQPKIKNCNRRYIMILSFYLGVCEKKLKYLQSVASVIQ